MPHENKEVIEKWIKYAQADMALAKVRLPEGVMYEQLCFHLQQAVEKSIKSLLLHYNKEFPFTHNLNALLMLLHDVMDCPSFLNDVVDLNPYAASMRYPGDYEEVTEEEYLEVLVIAEKALDFIIMKLKSEGYDVGIN